MRELAIATFDVIKFRELVEPVLRAAGIKYVLYTSSAAFETVRQVNLCIFDADSNHPVCNAIDAVLVEECEPSIVANRTVTTHNVGTGVAKYVVFKYFVTCNK